MRFVPMQEASVDIAIMKTKRNACTAGSSERTEKGTSSIHFIYGVLEHSIECLRGPCEIADGRVKRRE
jgi:hypothetical protein